jgi:hypothetical protein
VPRKQGTTHCCDPAKWSLDQVYQFVKLAADEIRGRTLISIKKEEMAFIMKVKHGPAIDIANIMAEMKRERDQCMQ